MTFGDFLGFKKGLKKIGEFGRNIADSSLFKKITSEATQSPEIFGGILKGVSQTITEGFQKK